MRVDSRVMVGFAIIALAVGGLVRALAPQGSRPAARAMRAPATPHLRVGGRVSRLDKPAKGIIRLDAFLPDARSAVAGFYLRADRSSLLLRADADGRLTPIELDDLSEGKDTASIRAVIAREADLKDLSHLIHWLVVYPHGVEAPPLRDKAPDTTYY